MKNMTKLALAGSALLLAGCASHSTKTVHLLQPADYALNTQANGINVGVETYDTDAKTKAAFDQNLVRKGVYPVQIVLDNTTDQNVLVVRDRIELSGSTVTSIRPMNAAEVAEKVEANAVAQAIFGFGIFSYAAAQNANDERAADYTSKQMDEELLLRSGRTDGGFVFFNLNDGESLSGRKLVIPIENVSNGDEALLEVQL